MRTILLATLLLLLTGCERPLFGPMAFKQFDAPEHGLLFDVSPGLLSEGTDVSISRARYNNAISKYNASK
jgi:hypothetical protein